jgi:hypothetical protein
MRDLERDGRVVFNEAWLRMSASEQDCLWSIGEARLQPS